MEKDPDTEVEVGIEVVAKIEALKASRPNIMKRIGGEKDG